MEQQFKSKGDSISGPIKKWATVAPLLGEYGTYLIREYPLEFARYYLLPNALKYYAPPVEFLERYNMGKDSVLPIAQVWFDYKNNKVRSYLKNSQINTLDFYPVLAGVMNVVFLLGVASFLFLQSYRRYPLLSRTLVLVCCFWAVNFGFSVFASPIALRFQLFPILVTICFNFFLVECIVKAAFTKED
jgi:hypothetical protein